MCDSNFQATINYLEASSTTQRYKKYASIYGRQFWIGLAGGDYGELCFEMKIPRIPKNSALLNRIENDDGESTKTLIGSRVNHKVRWQRDGKRQKSNIGSGPGIIALYYEDRANKQQGKVEWAAEVCPKFREALDDFVKPYK